MSTTDVTSAPASVDPPAPYRWRWVALFVILAAEVMDLLDALVTNIAGPSIRADLGGSASTLQWLAPPTPWPWRSAWSPAAGSATSSAAAGCS